MTALFATLFAAACQAQTTLVPATATLRPITLGEAYQAALARSEELARSRETLNETLARIDELKAAVKPRFSLVGTEILQDAPADTGGFTNSFAQRSRPQAALNVKQPLFSGFREFLAIKATRAQGEAARLALKRAEQSLYEDVAGAYVGLAEIQREIASRQEIAGLTADRIRDLKARERIGRSRKSEVLAAESLLSQVESDIASARGRERVAQFSLRFITGLAEDLSPAEVAAAPPAPLQAYLDEARGRADVEARRKDVEAAGFSVSLQRRQAWPTIGAEANYYLKRPKGFQQDIDWDAAFTAAIPLYLGGSIGAQARQAEARKRSAEQALSLAQRSAETQVRSAYGDLESSLLIVLALERSIELARRNAEAQAADYRLGLVTNLDVLSALNAVQETRIRLDRARLAAFGAKARLEVAAGGPAAPGVP